MTVMLGVGFGYPCWTFAPCLFTFRASADEETEMPRPQISNPSMTDVLLLLAMTMEFLHRLLSAPGNLWRLLPGEASRILARSESNPGPVKIFPRGKYSGRTLSLPIRPALNPLE